MVRQRRREPTCRLAVCLWPAANAIILTLIATSLPRWRAHQRRSPWRRRAFDRGRRSMPTGLRGLLARRHRTWQVRVEFADELALFGGNDGQVGSSAAQVIQRKLAFVVAGFDGFEFTDTFDYTGKHGTSFVRLDLGRISQTPSMGHLGQIRRYNRLKRLRFSQSSCQHTAKM
jgi:hypothetical protein